MPTTRPRQVHFNPPVGRVAGTGGRAAEAAAIRHDQTQAVQAFAGEIDFGRALVVDVFTVFLPGAALVHRDPDLDLADTAGAHLFDLVIEQYVRIVEDLLVDCRRFGRAADERRARRRRRPGRDRHRVLGRRREWAR